MLGRLSGDGSSEIAKKSFKVSKVSMFQGSLETLKRCHPETSPSIYLRMPSLVMTVL